MGSVPGFTFTTAATNGVYFDPAVDGGSLNLTTAGVRKLRIGTTSTESYIQSIAPTIMTRGGSPGAPAYTYNSSTSIGSWYNPSFSGGSIQFVKTPSITPIVMASMAVDPYTGTGVVISNRFAALSAVIGEPQYYFSGDPITGMGSTAIGKADLVLDRPSKVESCAPCADRICRIELGL